MVKSASPTLPLPTQKYQFVFTETVEKLSAAPIQL